MILNRNKLYLIIFIACLTGYIWVYYNITNTHSTHQTTNVCIIKHITNIPCPSCGSTRSIVFLAKGNFLDALFINPLGYIISFIMLLTPPWMIIDITRKKETLFQFYKKAETNLRKPQLAIPLISLIVFNWIWNITKGL